MPITRDVALGTQADVERYTHEVGLDNLDGTGGSSATIAQAMIGATNIIIVDLVYRDKIDPATVSNPTDLLPAWAFLTAYLILDAQEGDRYTARAERCRKRYEEFLAKYRYIGTAGTEKQLRDKKGLMITQHLDSEPVFNRPVNTTRPDRHLNQSFRGKDSP